MREDPPSSQRTSRSWHQPTALATNIPVPLRIRSALAPLSHFIRVSFSREVSSALLCDAGLPVLTPPPPPSFPQLFLGQVFQSDWPTICRPYLNIHHG